MIIGDRLKQLRESKHLTQGDIERLSGLLRCYVSRVENGHTIPAVETLEKLARAIGIPMYQLFYDSDSPPRERPKFDRNGDGRSWGTSRRETRYLTRLRQHLEKMTWSDRFLLLHVTHKMATRHSK